MSILDRFSKTKDKPADTPTPREKPTTAAPTVPAAPETGTPPSPGTEDRTLQITGDWLNQVWKEKPVQVFAEPDAAMAFLSQDELPYLWEDVQGYIDDVNGKPDPQRELRVVWTVAYLSHPEPEVVRRTLRDYVTPDLLNSWTVAVWIPFLMINPASGVREQAARRLWDCKDDSTITSVFGVFSGKHLGVGTVPNKYDAPAQYQRSAKDIVKTLREQCPPDRKELFEEQVSDVFGPSLAETDAPTAAGEVKFKEKEVRQRMGINQTYEVHTADSKANALAYLEKKTVTEANYYVIVETPEGNWGKDKMGVFEE